MEEQKTIKYCLACRHELSDPRLNEYVQCQHCRSYNYISTQSAEEDNKRYFNEIFKTFDDRKINDRKFKIFERFAGNDQKRRQQEYEDFNRKHHEIKKRLYGSAKVLEIGFGTGDHLNGMLQRGMDAYGIDISITAVENFKEKHKEFADRVWCRPRFDMKVDIIYCSALFEHLDKPWEFIQDSACCLNKEGFLIIDGLPVLNDNQNDFTVDEDINFWKPCHRAIYSLKGLKILFARSGFIDEMCAVHDDYYYRVLSLHLRHGYHSIEKLRSFYLEHKNLPSLPVFSYICWKALSIRSLAYYACIMFKKG